LGTAAPAQKDLVKRPCVSRDQILLAAETFVQDIVAIPPRIE